MWMKNDAERVWKSLLVNLVQWAGRALFIEAISLFMLLFLDEVLFIFVLKASGTVVASQRLSS